MIRIKNTQTHYGLIHLLMHWVVALLIAIIFPLGLIMVGLDYYDAGYHRYPPIHKSLGIILLMLTALRLLWIILSPPPPALPQKKSLAVIAKAVHVLLYLLIAVAGVSGYLISTADGRGIDVFSWFTVPAVITLEKQAEIAGEIHEIVTWTLVAIIALHVVGALKHHLIDKDRTLLRMFGK